MCSPLTGFTLCTNVFISSLLVVVVIVVNEENRNYTGYFQQLFTGLALALKTAPQNTPLNNVLLYFSEIIR